MRILFLFLVGSLFFSCQQVQEEKKVDNPDSTLNTAEIEDTSADIEQPIIASKKVKIQVYYKQDYCGGAYPNKEVLAELNKKRWYQDSPMRIYSNTADQLIFNFTTNHEGWAEVELPYGEYSLKIDTTANEQMSHLFNPKCKVVTEKIWKKFTVDDEKPEGENGEWVYVVLDFECDPCDPSMKMRP